jgi:glycosyltransferase involved in cell wall biosynthesis
LLSGYACAPNQGSEPGVGWNWAQQTSREHEVWLLTWSRFKDAIERELALHSVPNLHCAYYELPRWMFPRLWPERLHYILWQAAVLQLARRLHARHHFDVVHHVTFNTMEVPGLLWSLGAPFVWGPVGGGQMPPAALKRYFGRRWLFENVRRLRKHLLRWNPLVRMALERTACVLAANGDTEQRLAPMRPRLLIRELETAISLPQLNEPRQRRDGDNAFSVLWAGQLIARKAPVLAIEALAAARRRGVNARLVMAGDGTLRRDVEATIRRLRLADAVELLGEVPYVDMAPRYAAADAFLFTSLQDTSGNVVLEALARGLPVVCLDQHGAGEIVTDECGLKVPVVSETQVVQGLAATIERLARDGSLRARLSVGGPRRIAERYTWERKGDLVAKLYRDLTPRPAASATTSHETALAGHR